MNLKERQERYTELLKKEIDRYLEEHREKLVQPSSLKTDEQQMAQSRQELMQLISSNKADRQIEQALTLICSEMPQTVSKEVWEGLYAQFAHCEENLLHYFEEEEQRGESAEKQYVPLCQMCGFSMEALYHIYTFGQTLFKKGAYADAKLVMMLLMRLFPHMPEFWIAAAMCEKQLGEHQAAINLYKVAQAAFPQNVELHLHSAESYLAWNDKSQLK